MILLPAIDLYEGKAVRLYKGDYAQMTVYSENPPAVAADFAAAGAEWIHLVDLEGARCGATPNFAMVRRIRESITRANISFPNLVDPSLFMVDEQTFRMGEGNIIQNDCMISCDVTIGDFNLINDHVVVGHDNVIGNFNGLMPAAHLSGGITIGDNNLLGVASVVLQGMTIGNGVTLGANSVLMTQPRDNATYLGVPARKFDF